MANSEVRPLLDRREATDPDHKPAAWWANNVVQWFSHHFTRGTYDWQARFEPERRGSAWAYRPRRASR